SLRTRREPLYNASSPQRIEGGSQMAERAGAITMKGNPMTLVGNEVQVGQKAPDFTLTGGDMKPRTLKDFAGKVKIISVVPSIDTSVCATETRRFNEEASQLGDDVVILT